MMEPTTFQVRDVDGGQVWSSEGSPCGYLYRNFSMIHRFDRLYYAIHDNLLYEFMNDGDSPRAVFTLSHGNEEITETQSSSGSPLFCFKVFCKHEDEDLPGKVILLCATTRKCAADWVTALHHHKKVCEPDDREEMNKSPLLDSSTWSQEVIILGKPYQIPCTEISTNAWLLSESIRCFIRNNPGEKVPELNCLFNISQNKLLDLGDDVTSSVFKEDSIEATETPLSEFPVHIGATSPRGFEPLLRTEDIAHVGSLLDPLVIEAEFTTATKNFFGDVETQKRKIQKQLRELSFALDKKLPTWPSDGWMTKTTENGVRMYVSKASSQYFASMIVPCSSVRVVAAVLDMSKDHCWNRFAGRGRLMEASDAAEVVSYQLDNTFGIPFFNRSICISRFWHKMLDGSYVILLIPSRHPCISKSRKTADLSGVYLLRPFSEEGSDQEQCMLYLMFNFDFNVPFGGAWLADKSMVHMSSSLGALRVACMTSEELKY